MTTDCQGTWGFPRSLPESDIEILTCTDCRELWAIDHGRFPQWSETFPPGTPDMTIIHRYLNRKEDA